jgi:hypothetical protein
MQGVHLIVVVRQNTFSLHLFFKVYVPDNTTREATL